MKTTAIILSGGAGSRFGSRLPKQYIEIQGKNLLQYTLEAFLKSDVDELVIVAAPEYIGYCGELARKTACDRPAQVIEGGRERYASVRNGLQYLMREATEPDPTDIVLIHDGARPFIRPETIREIISQAEEYGAAIAAAPCTDTIKIADPEGFITATTQRALTWAAQTPQAFFTKEIWQAYELIIGGGQTGGITDDAMVYQMAFPEKPVKLVDAGVENFKITTRMDLVRAEGMIHKKLCQS